MSPLVEIPEPVFKRLQELAEPLVDTPASVIAKLLDSYGARGVESGHARETSGHNKSVRSFDPSAPPSLLHTHVREASFGERSTSRTWTNLVLLAHEVALVQLKSIDKLIAVSDFNIRPDRYGGKGYKFAPDLGVSIQGVDANVAWRNSLRLAKKLRVPIAVTVEWDADPRAAYPGQRGLIRWNPGSADPERGPNASR